MSDFEKSPAKYNELGPFHLSLYFRTKIEEEDNRENKMNFQKNLRRMLDLKEKDFISLDKKLNYRLRMYD